MVSTSWILTFLQQADAGGAPEPSPAGLLLNLAPIFLMVGVMYIMVLRPSMRQKRAHADFLASMQKDDEVITDSGFCGRVVALEERVAVLEIADKVRVRVLRPRIQGAWSAAVAPPAQPVPGRKAPQVGAPAPR